MNLPVSVDGAPGGPRAAAAGLLLLLTIAVSLTAQETPARPNVLILFTDDQRADTIAAFRERGFALETPNLDRLARRGVSMTRVRMQGSRHGATCVPSRAMLFSGRSLFRVDERLERDPTWPQAFAQAGYTTFLTGKWHNQEASVSRNFQRGRGIFTGGMTNPLSARLRDLVDGNLTKAVPVRQHTCEVFADEAIRFLQEDQQAPFFCVVAFNGPHDPHIVPDDFSIQYKSDDIPLPGNYLERHPFDNGEMEIRDEKLLPWPRAPDQVRQMLADYYRYVSYLDFQVGRILDAIEASPHADSTLIVFASDSGVARGSHGLIGKQNLYEHSVRVPLIIAGPGIPEGKSSSALCYLFDLLPTLGDLCDVASPETSEGLSVRSSLLDPQGTAREELFLAYGGVQRAVCDARWKLIHYPRIDQTQLFDLENDPGEVVNLALKPDHAARVEEMKNRLRRLQEEFDDPGS
jgi:arylsulfatase A-like enzyme